MLEESIRGETSKERERECVCLWKVDHEKEARGVIQQKRGMERWRSKREDMLFEKKREVNRVREKWRRDGYATYKWGRWMKWMRKITEQMRGRWESKEKSVQGEADETDRIKERRGKERLKVRGRDEGRESCLLWGTRKRWGERGEVTGSHAQKWQFRPCPTDVQLHSHTVLHHRLLPLQLSSGPEPRLSCPSTHAEQSQPSQSQQSQQSCGARVHSTMGKLPRLFTKHRGWGGLYHCHLLCTHLHACNTHHK